MRYPTMNQLLMNQLLRHRGYFILILALVGVVVYALFITFWAPPYPFKVPRSFTVDPVPTRRDLARNLLKIQRQIEFHAGFDNKVDAAWAKGLMAVIAELDPRVTTSDVEEDRYHSLLQFARPTTISDPSDHEPPNVCPEVYKGREYDKIYQHNFLEVKCKAKKFKEVLTFVVVAKGWAFNRLEFVVQNFRKHYSVDIVVLAFGNSPKTINTNGVVTKIFREETSEASALNKIVPAIVTPYTLVVRSLIHFSDQSLLERLVRVLDGLGEVVVAAGSYRDTEGYWRPGCLQATAENYELRYARGYEHSSHECMYCDDVLGPFVVKTDFLKRVPMTETVDGPAMYRDWFLNVRINRKLVVSCPDVMFFVDSEPIMRHTDWLAISRLWSFQHITSFLAESLEFSCEDAQISCINLMKTVSSFLVPPCCRKEIREELGYFQDCAKELGLYYELQAGSLLGAVKMNGILPWDFDSDIKVDCVDLQTWLTKGVECMATKGCTSAIQHGSYFVTTCKLATIDITCRYNMTVTLPIEYRKVATKAELNERWTAVATNPALTSRNKYGPEYLKHAVHWRYYAFENSSVLKDRNPKVTGLWSKCAEPNFHSCLDHFPVDGNIRFKNSVCRSP